MPFIDTHCHLTHGRFSDDVDVVVAACQGAGIQQMITIGTGLEDGALEAPWWRNMLACYTQPVALIPSRYSSGPILLRKIWLVCVSISLPITA